MEYKRILTVQDISCVGQCSMTVTLPILSACGHEACILPTALLSTHTGGFGKPAVVHLHESLDPIWRHWQENHITFDAILVGYLGNIQAIENVQQIMSALLAPGGIVIADPAMADHGKLYSGFDENYAQAMGELCEKADIMLPNITEAAMLSGMPYRKELTQEYVSDLLDALDHRKIVLTGVSLERERTGVMVWEDRKQTYCPHRLYEKSYHGTGDIFAAAFTGLLMQGFSLAEAARLASGFTCRCIEQTDKNPVHWYGVKFEPVLPVLFDIVRQQRRQ